MNEYKWVIMEHNNIYYALEDLILFTIITLSVLAFVLLRSDSKVKK